MEPWAPCDGMEQVMDCTLERPGFESSFCLKLTLRPWVNYKTSLILHFYL